MSPRRRKRKLKAIGCEHDLAHTLPGTLVAESASHPSKIDVIAFGPTSFEETTVTDVDSIRNYLGKFPITWVNVDGLGDIAAVRKIGEIFGLHELALEDTLCPLQRAKVEVYGDQLFVVLRSVRWMEDHAQMEQVSIFTGKGFVVTFQERPDGDCLDPLRERLRRSLGHVRTEGSDYLVYSLIDSVIDAYFPVVEGLGDELDQLEDQILSKIDKYTPAHILDLKREILTVRRSVWPARDVVNTLTRDDMSNFVSPRTRTYLRDCYDHANRIIDLVETHREMCADLMDLYLSSVSNRMNEVMKVLTTITLLFMPPTLIAGIYGMNFDRKSAFNMPELGWEYGYFYALVLMVVSSIVFWYYGRRHGWLHEVDEPKS